MEITSEGLRIWTILSTKLITWFHDAVAIFPNLIVAAVVMVLSNSLAKIISRLMGRILMRTSESVAVTRLIESSTRLLILFAGLFTALGILNLDKTVGSLLAGAGVIGLAIGFAFQEIASNFFSGILIALRKPFALGDIVQVDSFVGSVVDMTLRTTNLAPGNGPIIMIPNKDMFTKSVTNFTSVPSRQINLKVRVSYDSDLELVQNVALAAVQNIPGRLPDKPPEFYYTDFGDSSISCQVLIWVEFPANNYFGMGTHLAIMQITKAFKENGIKIPYPTRSLEFSGELPIEPASGASGLEKSPAPKPN